MNFIIMIVVNGFLALLDKPVKPNRQKVVLSKFLLILGIIASGTVLITTILMLFSGESVTMILMFNILSLLGYSLIIAYFNCRITYNETNFTAKNFWGVKRTYTYNDITGIDEKSKDVKVYMGKRIVKIDSFSVGKKEFLCHAKKQYRQLNNGKYIPIVAPKSDILKGNIERGGEHVFLGIMMILIPIGMLVFYAIESRPNTADDLEHTTLSFERYEIQNDTLLLYERGNPMYYSIPAYKILLPDADKFLELCDDGTTFDVGYVISKYADNTQYELESIVGKDKTVFLTTEAVHDYVFKDSWKFYMIFGGFLVLFIVFLVMSIYVGRNVEKFSPRFVKMFFKEEVVRPFTEKDRKR